jgi:hypothetical protein
MRWCSGLAVVAAAACQRGPRVEQVQPPARHDLGPAGALPAPFTLFARVEPPRGCDVDAPGLVAIACRRTDGGAVDATCDERTPAMPGSLEIGSGDWSSAPGLAELPIDPAVGPPPDARTLDAIAGVLREVGEDPYRLGLVPTGDPSWELGPSVGGSPVEERTRARLAVVDDVSIEASYVVDLDGDAHDDHVHLVNAGAEDSDGLHGRVRALVAVASSTATPYFMSSVGATGVSLHGNVAVAEVGAIVWFVYQDARSFCYHHEVFHLAPTSTTPVVGTTIASACCPVTW